MSIKRLIKILILAVLYAFYKAIAWMHNKKGLVVLMYHSINPESLEKQLEYLKCHHYKFITVEEWLNQNNKEAAGQKKVLLTFDDGYQDLLMVAWPILKKFNAPALAFIHTSRSSKNLGNNSPMLNWNEVRELNRNGVAVANHSHSHQNLKTLSQEELGQEVKNSEEMFKRELSYVPKVFAYPGGKYNGQIAEKLRGLGYQAAFTIDEGLVYQNDDPLRLKRIGVGNETTMFEFQIILTPAFGWYQFLRKIFGFKK